MYLATCSLYFLHLSLSTFFFLFWLHCLANKLVFFFVTLPIFFLTLLTAVVNTATDATLIFVVGRLWGVAGSAETDWFRSRSGGGGSFCVSFHYINFFKTFNGSLMSLLCCFDPPLTCHLIRLTNTLTIIMYITPKLIIASASP